jgi:hypothetical protein
MGLGYAGAMLCQICQKRTARVHQTFVSSDRQTQTVRHLCEVCAGTKTEQQSEEERKESRMAIERRGEKSWMLVHQIQNELLEPRSALLQSNQIRTRGWALNSELKLALVGVFSRLKDVDPLNLLFGPFQNLTNHVVQQVTGCEVHVIRWHPDPKQYLNHLFEVFPQAGPSLDLEKRLLLVAAERDLFPNAGRSLEFCNLAAGLLGSGLPQKDRFRFQSKAGWVL